jgi:hypothetical protein
MGEVVVYSRHYPAICIQELAEENHEKAVVVIAALMTKIRNMPFPNMSTTLKSFTSRQTYLVRHCSNRNAYISGTCQAPSNSGALLSDRDDKQENKTSDVGRSYSWKSVPCS